VPGQPELSRVVDQHPHGRQARRSVESPGAWASRRPSLPQINSPRRRDPGRRRRLPRTWSASASALGSSSDCLPPAPLAGLLSLFDELLTDAATTAGALPPPRSSLSKIRDLGRHLIELPNMTACHPAEATELFDACRTGGRGPGFETPIAGALSRLLGSLRDGSWPPVKGLAILVGYLEQRAYLQQERAGEPHRHRAITRIVGSSIAYSHLDQAHGDNRTMKGLVNTLRNAHTS